MSETPGIAVVTGTSSGIGLATCARLASHGYRVFAGMRNPEKAPGSPKALMWDDVQAIRAKYDELVG